MRPEIKKYNEADIQRYIDQKMSPEEMYAFEKALAADPFLSDAVDGWMASNPSLQNKHLAELTKKIQPANTTENAAPVVPIAAAATQGGAAVHSIAWYRQGWLQAAAVMIIIAGLAWFAYDKFYNKGVSEIALEDKVAEEELAYSAPLEPVDEGAINIPLDSPVNVPIETQPEAAIIESPKEKVNTNPAPTNQYVPPVVTQAPRNSPQQQTVSSSPNSKTRTTKTNPTEFNDEEVSVQNASATKQGNSILYTPSTGQPNKSVANNNQQAAQQPATPPQTKVQQAPSNPQPAPKYNYDSTYGPLTGWHAYITYLESETRKRQNLAQRGVVKLYFNIDNRGRPIDIDVTGDQSPELRQLALDILNNGAGWRRITEQGKMSLTVHFK